MTVFTPPASQLDRAAGPESRPAPWSGMLWVTWRQHRGLLIGVSVVFCAAVAGLLVTGLRIHHDYALPAPRVTTEPVADAIDPGRNLSATPSTPIGDVAGVGDRSGNLSLA